MISAVADIFATLPQMIVAGFFVGKYIQAKHQRRFFWIYVLVQLVIYTVTGHVLNNAYNLRGIFSIVAQITMILGFCQIPRSHGIVYLMMSNACMFIAEILVDTAAFYIMPNFMELMITYPAWSITMKLIILPMIVISYVVPFWLCHRLFKTEGDSEITRYIPFLLLQVFITIVPMLMALSFTDNYVFINVMCVIYLVANFGLDLLLMHTFGKINQAHALELRQEQIQYMFQAQVDYYNQLRDSASTIRQIRHDMGNQLHTLSILLEDGQTELVTEQLSSLRETIGRTGKSTHTGNPVVDAVIESKLGLCTEAGINLQCEGNLPTNVAVKAVSLCSIAANLLDNAIHACQRLQTEAPLSIRFSASVKNDRIVFLCQNPVLPGTILPNAEPMLSQEHGWGVSILRNIAAEYHGELQMQQQKDVVTSILWIHPDPLTEGANP